MATPSAVRSVKSSTDGTARDPAGKHPTNVEPEEAIVAGTSSRHAHRGRSLALTVVLLLALLDSAAIASTTAPGGGPTLSIDDRAGNQVDPHISDTLVSYTSQAGSNTEIRYHDLATGAHGAIPGTGQDLLSGVFAGTVVFTRFVLGGAGVFVYDTTTSALWELDPRDGTQRRAPAIGGTLVAWEDYGLAGEPITSEIVVYDDDGTTTRLTEDELFDLRPRISPDGSVIVWLKCTSVSQSGCEVWRAERGSAGWTTTLVSTDGEHASADSDGEVVVYAATRAGERDVYWTPVSGGSEQRLSSPGIQRNPNVSDGLISYESVDGVTGTFDVWVHDIHTQAQWRLTETPTLSEQLNDISVGTDGKARVVWSSGLSGDLNVYASEFTPPGRGTRDITFDAPVSAPPDVNVLKGGRVLPVRVAVSVDGVADHSGPVAIELHPLAACPEGAIDQPVDATAPGASNTGNLFRFEAASGRWIYNLDTKGLTAGGCYRAAIFVGGTIDPDTGRATGGTLAGWFLLRLRS